LTRSQNNVPSGATCVYVHCISKGLALLKSSCVCLSSTKWTLSSHRKVVFSPRYSWNKSHLVLNNKHPFTNIFENIQQINRKKERGHSILVLKKPFFGCTWKWATLHIFSEWN